MVSNSSSTPVTAVCIVSDKNRCPVGYEVVKLHEDKNTDADVWKEGFFNFKSVYRYIAFCRSYPEGTFVFNVVVDIALVNDKDMVPVGFTAVDLTEDTREKALRKKVLCIKTMPIDSAVDAVSDIVLLYRERRPPPGYTLAGDIDGLLFCFKYSVVDKDSAVRNSASFPGLPYPLHPSADQSESASTGGIPGSHSAAPLHVQTNDLSINGDSTVSPKTILHGVPFELHPSIKLASDRKKFDLQPASFFTHDILEEQFSYPFRVEQSLMDAGED